MVRELRVLTWCNLLETKVLHVVLNLVAAPAVPEPRQSHGILDWPAELELRGVSFCLSHGKRDANLVALGAKVLAFPLHRLLACFHQLAASGKEWLIDAFYPDSLVLALRVHCRAHRQQSASHASQLMVTLRSLANVADGIGPRSRDMVGGLRFDDRGANSCPALAVHQPSPFRLGQPAERQGSLRGDLRDFVRIEVGLIGLGADLLCVIRRCYDTSTLPHKATPRYIPCGIKAPHVLVQEAVV
mmetsp:Transcript_43201/g.78147  ORF Transcript_43201/g.78147 Transcript_43201/m.78147 type:complete len:244 (-) Transcript_43201:249-980(-)